MRPCKLCEWTQKTPGQNDLKQNKDYRSQKHLKTLRFTYRVLYLDIVWSGICKMVTRYNLVFESWPSVDEKTHMRINWE